MDDKEIGAALLANVTDRWRKMAFVIGRTMLQMGAERPGEFDDAYFASRLQTMIEAGQVECNGEPGNIRECEVRLPT